jgi:hypothetical protein
MESMRALNKSLPSSQGSRQAPPEQLLQAFRTAALSVTNLYKSAVTGQADSRRTGYQDALEDLLKFLDQENLGVQDGEGWRIRQWATQRYDGGSYQNQSDTEDESSEPEPKPEVLSPPQAQINDAAPQTLPVEDTAGNEEDETDHNSQRPQMYHFQANRQSESEMQTDEAPSPQTQDVPSSSSPAAPIRVEVRNRNTKPMPRTHSARHNNRSGHRDFTFSAGTKRKLQFPDFFDISNIPDKPDGASGGSGPKRGRFV